MEVLFQPRYPPSSHSLVETSLPPSNGDMVAKSSRETSAKREIFDMITSELLKIGAIPLSRFMTEDNPEEQLYNEEDAKMDIDDPEEKHPVKGNEQQQAVAKIYGACMRTFESSDAIGFDFTHGDDLNSRGKFVGISESVTDAGSAVQCILTITRPDGHKRSYTSGNISSATKVEAKVLAASSALNMGVIDFIKYGDITLKGKIINGLKVGALESLDAQPRLRTEDGKGVSFSDQNETAVDDPNVKAISDCCVEWRAGKVKPVYVHFAEPTIVTKGEGSPSANSF